MSILTTSSQKILNSILGIGGTMVAFLSSIAFMFTLGFANPVQAAAKAADQTKKATAKQTTSGGTKMADTKMTTVVIETSLGNIDVELNGEKAPVSTENFLKYVDSKHYDGLVFHRVIKDFMIQGGGMDESLRPKETNAPIKNEAQNGLKNDRGTIAMARTSVIDSATSQFFINTVDNKFLDHSGPGPAFGYAVFGKVTAGMDVVDKIRAVPTTIRAGMQDVPVTPVVIKTVRRK
jgi:cyclophilin family peptidyl-prolyl cis-trans isomerase